MQKLIDLIVIASFFYLAIFIIFAKAYIVIGTISKETEDFKTKLKSLGYKIIHADNYRNHGFNLNRPVILSTKDFLKNFFLLKRVALFTSNPRLLKWKFIIFIVSGIGLFVEDKRVTRLENVNWVLGLSQKDAREIIPDYFVDENERKISILKIEKMVGELNRYSNERFLPEKVWEGDMGGILKHN
jgi:hypothetical protein